MSLIPDQYLLLAKIGAVGALVVGVYLTGHHQGAKAVQADWDASRAMIASAQAKLVEDHAKEIADVQAKHDADNIKVSTDHEKALQDLDAKYRAAVTVARADGLRVSKSICSPAAAASETTSDSGHHDDTAGTVALPDQVTSDLLALVAEADRTTEIARACQGWIRANGFYTPIPPH